MAKKIIVPIPATAKSRLSSSGSGFTLKKLRTATLAKTLVPPRGTWQHSGRRNWQWLLQSFHVPCSTAPSSPVASASKLWLRLGLLQGHLMKDPFPALEPLWEDDLTRQLQDFHTQMFGKQFGRRHAIEARHL